MASIPLTISALTLPTSLTMQPDSSRGKNASVSGRIACTGVPIIKKSTPEGRSVSRRK
jgi:hypothetical protein